MPAFVRHLKTFRTLWRRVRVILFWWLIRSVQSSAFFILTCRWLFAYFLNSSVFFSSHQCYLNIPDRQKAVILVIAISNASVICTINMTIRSKLKKEESLMEKMVKIIRIWFHRDISTKLIRKQLLSEIDSLVIKTKSCSMNMKWGSRAKKLNKTIQAICTFWNYFSFYIQSTVFLFHWTFVCCFCSQGMSWYQHELMNYCNYFVVYLFVAILYTVFGEEYKEYVQKNHFVRGFREKSIQNKDRFEKWLSVLCMFVGSIYNLFNHIYINFLVLKFSWYVCIFSYKCLYTRSSTLCTHI